MRKLRWILLFPLLIVSILFIPAVRNSAFDLILETLLKNSVSQVTPEQVDLQSDLLLDTRELQEYEVSHLPGAVWVGYSDFALDRIPENLAAKRIVLYCSVGYRSEKIGEQLKAASQPGVVNLRGGIFRWSNEGLPLEKHPGEITPEIHPYNAFWGIWITKGNKTK
ncbi:MAG: rhodanese-like domain-containing protein [Bacteroidia bacterium]|nr:rhodanese-like domain-containing protein [Bacteroidia bacterium]